MMGTDYQDRLIVEISLQMYHKKAFTSLLSYIQNDVIGKQRSVLVRDLLAIYREEYISVGGDEVDVQTYTAQNLTRKLKDHLEGQVTVKLADHRKGNFIYSSVLTEQEAKSHLHDDAERYEQDNKLTLAALHLRSLIMQLPKTRTPDPTTVENLKECAPEIPAQLDLFSLVASHQQVVSKKMRLTGR